MSPDEYLELNRTNSDSRAAAHARGYGLDRLLADRHALSSVVESDRPRLGDIAGLDVVHLQRHIGTDTLSLARLGARVAGVDLSGGSLVEARSLAERTGVDIDYVQSVYQAPAALGGRRFDVVYTGIGAICWLPSIGRWAQTVAALLRPGGRLFSRDADPVLNAALAGRSVPRTLTVSSSRGSPVPGRRPSPSSSPTSSRSSRWSGVTSTATRAPRRSRSPARWSGTTGSARS